MTTTNNDPADGADSGAPTPTGLDAPEIQEAVRRAVEGERARAAEREQGLLRNRDELLEEKKRWAALGKPDELATRLKRLEELELAASAHKAGTKPEEFTTEVERVASEKFRQYERQQAEVQRAAAEKFAKLQEERDTLAAQAHRYFVEAQVYRESLPEELRIFQSGAEDHLISSLAPFVVRHQIPGLPSPVARLKVNEALVPGQSPDGLMSLREALGALRQPGGKGPLPIDLSFCFISNASGSGSRSPNSPAPPSGGNWKKMSDREKADYVSKHGAAAARALMDKST